MKRSIGIKTADGTAAAMLITPDKGSEPRAGVILYMDAFGPREALYWMGQRIADSGYVVLVPDLFYRVGNYGPYDAKTAFSQPESKAEILGMMRATSPQMTAQDTAAFMDALTQEGAPVSIGTVGYCMGGAHAITAAAYYPERIKAAASFHGGNLASESDSSPHRLADRIRARVYVGVAGVDSSFPPEQSGRLAEALRTGGVDHAIENYVGMAHGWTVPDHSIYDEAGSERHFKRLLTLFDETL